MRLPARLATVVWMLIAWTQLFALGSAAEPTAAAKKTGVLESFKFDPDDRWVLIPVRVGGKDYQFILDTGATFSVFDVTLRSHLARIIHKT